MHLCIHFFLSPRYADTVDYRRIEWSYRVRPTAYRQEGRRKCMFPSVAVCMFVPLTACLSSYLSVS